MMTEPSSTVTCEKAFSYQLSPGPNVKSFISTRHEKFPRRNLIPVKSFLLRFSSDFQL